MPTRCPKTNKICFADLATAGRNAARRRLDGTEENRTMTAYACGACALYHVGHRESTYRIVQGIVQVVLLGGAISATQLQWVGGPELLKRQMEAASQKAAS